MVGTNWPQWLQVMLLLWLNKMCESRRSEREYVTRAGTTTPFWWGSSITPTQANYDGSADPYKGGGSKGQYRKKTLPVEGFAANPWGLYQVHGNVWEWTQDCWNRSNAGNAGNGSARTIGECGRRVLRGGSWFSGPRFLRSANRGAVASNNRDNLDGFRVARTLTPERWISPRQHRHDQSPRKSLNRVADSSVSGARTP
jgi:formylglycine-generating enzyme required for sulfatase activity